MEFRPLFETLEFRVTPQRVCRSLGFVLDKPEQTKLSQKIRKLYIELSGVKPILVNGYKVYPIEFIPIMVNIANEFKK